MRRLPILGAVVLLTVVGGGLAWMLLRSPGHPAAPILVAAEGQRTVAADAPELARRGPHAVGVLRVELIQPDQPDLLGFNPVTGGVPRRDRTLAVEVWYPATLPPGAVEETVYSVSTPRTPTLDPSTLPETVSVKGRALRDAPALRGQGFPLVVLSHGFRNWATIFSTLAEHLASRGYVVASIAHEDAEDGPLLPVELAFGAVVTRRSLDQRFVIAELARRGGTAGDLLTDLFDPTRTALFGYSMGGFGALATAGAGYDPAGVLAQRIPGGLMAGLTEDAPDVSEGVPATLRALVLVAPWGGQPPLRAWTPTALGRIAVPSLTIAGDLDDVSGHADGVRWIWEAMTGSDRHLLLFQGARHNLPTDPVPPALAGYFQFLERFEEPVWRRDRLLAIQSHVITAFLDLHLKQDAAKAAYLDVPTRVAADGVWPLAPGVEAGDRTAAPDAADSAGYWAGFQRRWAVGLELHLRRAGTTDEGPGQK